MNVLYTIDKSYVEKLVVSMISLMNYVNEDLNIYIACDGVDKKIENNIKRIENNYVKVYFLNTPNVSKKLNADRGAQAQFYRLYLTEMFRDINIDRILYLDADTLIVSSRINELYNTDLKSYTLGATLDPWSSTYRKVFGLNTKIKMFNSGIMLVDLNKWKDCNIDQKLNYIINTTSYISQGDQGILNILFAGEFYVLSPEFNALTSYFEMTYSELIRYRKPILFYEEESIIKAIEYPVVVHFTSTFLHNRPWILDAKHPYKSAWIQKYTSHFENLNLQKQNIGINGFIYKSLPKFLSLTILSLLQSRIRPEIEYLKYKIYRYIR